MPSKTRGPRAPKTSKENIGVVKTTKAKKSGKVLKVTRKPLADKTNSASDDNASILSDKLKKPVASVPIKPLVDACEDNVNRPRRARRLPTRYKENNTLKKLSNSLNLSPSKQESPVFQAPTGKKITVVSKPVPAKETILATKKTSQVKKSQIGLTLTKSPAKSLDCSLVKTRPKRICRLPNKFDNHLISPNKYVPLQPIYASTPLARKPSKVIKDTGENSLNIYPVFSNKVSKQKVPTNSEQQKLVPDSNNNAKKNKEQLTSSEIPSTPGRIFRSRTTDRDSNKNSSIRLLDDNKNQRKRDSSKLDVYEFTYDPKEEPQPAKKKKKKPAPRKPKPKTVTVKSNYDRNLAKALATLKNAVSSKSNTDTVKQNKVLTTLKENVNKINVNHTETPPYVNNLNLVVKQGHDNEKNYNSVRVEDIARDFLVNEDDHVFDYSPVNSPSQPKTPTEEVNTLKVQTPNNVDPLNLRDDISFFDDIPVASSSMNVSVRHPQASPWRIEFGNLPIKWQVNTYVKPNMTPAFESSFINFNDSNKKHVYTNLVPEANDSLPQAGNTSNMKQTSIISFIKEVVVRNANKKKNKSSPIKTNSLFEDLSSTSIVDHKTPNKQTPLNNIANVNKTPGSGNNFSNTSNEKEPLDNDENNTENVKKNGGLNENSDKNHTYFGFDDIEDQENVSPIKKNNRARALRSRTRGILQEINEHKGPSRLILPVAVKSKPAKNIINTDEIKSATEPPVFPEIAVDGNTDMSNIQESCLPENLEDDDQSVHLFEDIDLALIYHPKPVRKSYGKAKKVTYNQKPGTNNDDSSTSDGEGKIISSDEENLDDLSFKLPSERPKKTIRKRKPKKQLSKKEEKEVEEWAAGFNSMCEDIDDFNLVVE